MVAGTIGLLAVAGVAVLAIDPRSPARATPPASPARSGPPGPPRRLHAARRARRRGRACRLTAAGPLIVTFMYTTCQDDCPTMAQQIRGALDDLGRDAVPVIAVSVDPARDTPARALRFIAEQSLRGPDALRARRRRGASARLAQVRHPAAGDAGASTRRGSCCSTRSGRQRIGFPVDKLTSEGVQHDVLALLREQRAGVPA